MGTKDERVGVISELAENDAALKNLPNLVKLVTRGVGVIARTLGSARISPACGLNEKKVGDILLPSE